jgi:phosphate starvation-inducible protein PhoH and related proteins
MSRKPQVFGKQLLKASNGKPVYAKSHNQHELVKTILQNDIIFINGPAGVGKTFIAIVMAIQLMEKGLFRDLILTRPSVESGEKQGSLPGDLMEKVSPYMKPLFDTLTELRGKSSSAARQESEQDVRPRRYRGKPNKFKKELDKNKAASSQELSTQESFSSEKLGGALAGHVHVRPLGFLRGSTFKDAYVILDEAQNVTKKQMEMFLTRMGEDCKVIICGDARQCDIRPSQEGFEDAQDRLGSIDGIAEVNLDLSDIMRHKLVREIIIKYAHQFYQDELIG